MPGEGCCDDAHMQGMTRDDVNPCRMVQSSSVLDELSKVFKPYVLLLLLLQLHAVQASMDSH